jgi:stage II sporulation protein D
MLTLAQPSTATQAGDRRWKAVRTTGLLAALALLLCAAPADAASRLVIRGAGFGHGIGMSQYGAYGLALQGVRYDAILSRYYTGTQLSALSSNPDVRVLLQSGERKVTVSGVSRLGDRALDPAKTYNVIRGGSGLVLRHGSQRLATSTPPMRLESTSASAFMLAGTSVPGIRNGQYRGALELRPSGRGINAINALDLETYVRGVVSAESPSAWPAEQLKAQSVAARTYAITSRAGSLSDGFDQYADTRSQVYRGVAAERPSTDAAVAATAGQVVTYQGQPVTTFFFSTSGGHTEHFENSFVGSAPKPWLKGVADPYDGYSPKHRWGPITLSTASATANLRGLVRGKFRRIRVLQRGVSPRIVRAEVVGSRGVTRVTGPQLRARFGLNDTWAYFTTVTSGVKRSAPAPKTPPPAKPTTPPATTTTPTETATGGVTAGAARARAIRAPVLSGSIAPAKPGAALRVQRRTKKGRWRTAVDAQLDGSGRYAVAVPGPGVYRVLYGKDVAGPSVRVR